MQQAIRKPYILFFVFWLLLFVLYLPTAQAGFVADFTGWLNEINTQSFWVYINRSNFVVNSLYQFTQFTTYIIYRVIGANAWAWHIVHISLQALNAYLWFLLCYRIFTDSGIKNAKAIALAGVLLFCVSPYLTEVIVWEPSFHYLQGFLLILVILLQVQKFHYAPKIKYAIAAGILFLLSTYSLEIFYLTPVFTITLALYYRFALDYNKVVFKKILTLFFLPQLLLFLAHLGVYHLVYGEWLPHLKDQAMRHSWAYYLSKPAKYIFQVVLLGRYFPQNLKFKIYDIFESKKAIILVVSLVALVLGFIVLRFQKFNVRSKAATLIFIWILPVLFIMGPLWFPLVQPYVFCDRYVYVLSAFVYMLGCALLSYITNRYVFWFLVSAYGLFNIYFTIQTNNYWKESASIIHNLLHEIPATDKTVILLNTPENLQGVPMMDATPGGEYKLMHNEFVCEKITAPVYDAMAFNMNNANDGARVTVLNDSTIGVTLNQWGTWWWYNAQGGISYKNNDYSINVIAGHYYELTLKKPASSYMIFYMARGHWHQVNWNLKTSTQY